MSSAYDDTILLPKLLDEGADTSCSICLAEAGQEPVRIIRSCRHSFHAACLDEWLTRSAECPLCRSELPSYVARACEQAAIQQLQEVVQLLQRDVEITRSILTFAAITELLQRYPRSLGAGGLREAVDRVEAILESIQLHGVRPARMIQLNNRSMLTMQAREHRRIAAEILGCPAAAVPRHPRVQAAREHVRAAFDAL